MTLHGARPVTLFETFAVRNSRRMHRQIPERTQKLGELGPFLVPISLFVSLAAVAIFRGPMGKALGERISGRQLDADTSAEAEVLHADMDELRFRLSEVEERLDFTERLLTRQGGQDGQGAMPTEQR